jgi:calcineurin-like phosphoesterase family protein
MIETIAVGDNNIFITADTHFDHGNIIKYCNRPFLGPLDRAELDKLGGRWHDGNWKGEESSDWDITQTGIRIMNETLIHNINKTVPENATLIHAGDFCLWPKKPSMLSHYLNRCRDLREQIKCNNMILLWGNHDTNHSIANLFRRNGHRLFQWTGQKCKIKVTDDLQIVVGHYCEAVWDCSHRGSLHCYGHSHSEIEEGLDRIMPGRRSMDIGVDNANKILGEYRPFSITEIVDRLASRPGFSINPSTPTSYKGKSEEESIGN